LTINSNESKPKVKMKELRKKGKKERISTRDRAWVLVCNQVEEDGYGQNQRKHHH
jgi:hypothetical protein